MLSLNTTVTSFLHIKYAVPVLLVLPMLTLNELPAVVPLVALLLVDAPNVVQFVFIVGVGTVTLAVVAPLYIVLLAVFDSLAHPFVLNVTVTSFLHIKYAVPVLLVLPTLTLSELPAVVPLVALLLVDAPNVVQFVFIVGVGTVTLAVVAPLYIVVVAVLFSEAQLFALNVTVTSFFHVAYLGVSADIANTAPGVLPPVYDELDAHPLNVQPLYVNPFSGYSI